MKSIKEMKAILHKIEQGKLTIKPSDIAHFSNALSWGTGDVEYDVSNGWKISLFIDGSDLDYLNSMTDAEGNEVDFWDNDGYEFIRNYYPSRAIIRNIYRIK